MLHFHWLNTSGNWYKFSLYLQWWCTKINLYIFLVYQLLFYFRLLRNFHKLFETNTGWSKSIITWNVVAILCQYWKMILKAMNNAWFFVLVFKTNKQNHTYIYTLRNLSITLNTMLHDTFIIYLNGLVSTKQ